MATIERFRRFVTRMPKIEVHCHMEGAVPLQFLQSLTEKYEPGQHSLASLQQRFAYRDFPHFLECWMWKNRFFRAAADFESMAHATVRSFVDQGYRHVEFFISPGDFVSEQLHFEEVAHAIESGIKSAITGSALHVALIADLVRDAEPEEAARRYGKIRHLRREIPRIVGIGLGGSEHRFPARLFATTLLQAKADGFRTTCHAGEFAGPESIWDAVRLLHVDRIGHGTSAIADPRLVEHLRTHQIALECCPLSNVRTAVIPNLRAHPILDYLRAGLRVSVNTDDPVMFESTLSGEFLALRETFGITEEHVVSFQRHAIDSLFAEPTVKTQLHAELDAYATQARL